ncbi:MAG TPA: hypothetical protein P5277_00735 [Candidatus Paceibacterota bacterium]|nr:hypothetical protein [Candidatus Paceibacterota bacterium]
MALKLNPEREVYREFYGQNVAQMPLLVADRRVPMNVAQLLQRRLDVRNSDADVRTAYHDNYFDTGDAIAYHPDGRVKVVLDSQTLREINPKSQLTNGALVLTEDAYRALDGVEFKKGKLEKVNEGLSIKEVKAHPVWKVLTREDKALLDDYADWAFTEYRDRFAQGSDVDDIRIMGIYPDSAGEAPKLRAWCVNRLEDGSNANGRYLLGDDNGRFLGIAPEALSAPGKGALSVRLYTVADVQKAQKQLEQIDSVVRPESISDVKSLISRL